VHRLGTVTVDGRATGSTRLQDSATTRGVCATGGTWIGLWSALHLDDGTHVHGVNMTNSGRSGSASAMCKIPGQCRRAGRSEYREAFDANGLPLDATLS